MIRGLVFRINKELLEFNNKMKNNPFKYKPNIRIDIHIHKKKYMNASYSHEKVFNIIKIETTASYNLTPTTMVRTIISKYQQCSVLMRICKNAT